MTLRKKEAVLGGAAALVTLVLLAYSFELAETFAAMFAAIFALEMLVRQINATLKDRSRGRIVRLLFWGATGVLLISAFALAACLRFEGRIYWESAVIEASVLASRIAFIIAVFILLFLRSRTRFPRWTWALGVLGILVPAFFLNVFFLSRSAVTAGSWAGRPSLPLDAFDVKLTARGILREDKLEVEEERYEIFPKSHFSLTGVDKDWQHRQEDLVIDDERHFESAKNPKEIGLMVKCRRTIVLDNIDLGLLRRKATIPIWDLRDLRVDVVDSESTKSTQSTEPPSQPDSFLLEEISKTASKVEITLPRNAFLSAYPKGELIRLPDRDQVVFQSSEGREDIDLYYLKGLRLDVVRALLSDSSGPDLLLKSVAFLFWPVVLLILGMAQQSLRDWALGIFRRDSHKRQAGF